LGSRVLRALAAGNRVASSGAADGPVVLLPDDDGPYELVMDDADEDWDEDWDEGLEAGEATGEDADEDETVIGDGVQHGGRPVRSRGRTSAPSRASAGPQAKAIPAKAGPSSSQSPGQEVALPGGPIQGTIAAGGPVSTPGALRAGVLGAHLEDPTGLALPPVELFAAPAGHSTAGAAGAPALPVGDKDPLATSLVAALLAVGLLGAVGAVMHRPRRACHRPPDQPLWDGRIAVHRGPAGPIATLHFVRAPAPARHPVRPLSLTPPSMPTAATETSGLTVGSG
jgi:hypothetical protein